MDLNKQSQNQMQSKMSSTGISKAKNFIEKTIRSNQQTFWPDILKANNGIFSFEEIQEAKRQMILDGVIRMREDSFEHDWEWVLT